MDDKNQDEIAFGNITIDELYTSIYNDNRSARKKLLNWIDTINEDQIESDESLNAAQFASVVQSSYDTLNKYDANLIKIADIISKNKIAHSRKTSNSYDIDDDIPLMSLAEKEETLQTATKLLNSMKG